MVSMGGYSGLTSPKIIRSKLKKQAAGFMKETLSAKKKVSKQKRISPKKKLVEPFSGDRSKKVPVLDTWNKDHMVKGAPREQKLRDNFLKRVVSNEKMTFLNKNLKNEKLKDGEPGRANNIFVKNSD